MNGQWSVTISCGGCCARVSWQSPCKCFSRAETDPKRLEVQLEATHTIFVSHPHSSGGFGTILIFLLTVE